jgi:hypothetical protein
MADYVSYLESNLAYYKAMIEIDKQSIKHLKESIERKKDNLRKCKSENSDNWYINTLQDWIIHDTAELKETRARKIKLEKELKDNEAKIIQAQIKNFVSSNQRFTVIQGGLCN